MGKLLDFGVRRIVGMILSWVAAFLILNIILGSAMREGRPLTNQEKGNINIFAIIIGFFLSLWVTHGMKQKQQAKREAKRFRRWLQWAFIRPIQLPFRPPPPPPPPPPDANSNMPPRPVQNRWPYPYQRRKP